MRVCKKKKKITTIRGVLDKLDPVRPDRAFIVRPPPPVRDQRRQGERAPREERYLLDSPVAAAESAGSRSPCRGRGVTGTRSRRNAATHRRRTNNATLLYRRTRCARDERETPRAAPYTATNPGTPPTMTALADGAPFTVAVAASRPKPTSCPVALAAAAAAGSRSPPDFRVSRAPPPPTLTARLPAAVPTTTTTTTTTPPAAADPVSGVHLTE